MDVKPSRRDEHTEATKRALLRAARDLFARFGFEGATTEQIVRRARVTRGALYHHFPHGKKELFRAVFEELELEIVTKVAGASSGQADPWTTVVAGIRSFLDA